MILKEFVIGNARLLLGDCMDILPTLGKVDAVITDDWVAVYEIDGRVVANGEPGDGVYTSKELLANPTACGDARVDELRAKWDGRVVG